MESGINIPRFKILSREVECVDIELSDKLTLNNKFFSMYCYLSKSLSIKLTTIVSDYH